MNCLTPVSKCAPTMLAIASLAASSPAQAGTGAWDDAGSITRDALVAAALATPAIQRDWNGTLQAAGSIGATAALTYSLKQSISEWRPDRSDRKSFPSGHTSVSFAAAATLENRYGWKAGLPAHLAAMFVAVSRVEARKHHWHDVLAGAALGEASGLLLTRRHDNDVRYFPWSDGRGGGIAVAMRF